MAVVTLQHIDIDEKGVARIAGSRIKVQHLISEHRFHGWTPEQIRVAHPHLTLSQIHAAFVYYYDHQDLVDQQIRESEEFAAKLHRENEPSQKALVEKLRARLADRQ